MRLKFILSIFCLIIFGASSASAQFLAGPKVGGMLYRASYEEVQALETNNIRSKWSPSYNIGAIFMYQLTEKYSLHTELLYTKKGKLLKGGIKDEFAHNATYEYVEVPLLFKMNFKQKYYTSYFGIGGNFSYWMSGKGRIESFEHEEIAIPYYEYNIRFSEYDPFDESGDIYLEEHNRLQVGLDLGVGALFNTLNAKNKIMVDIRYQLGHSWSGKDQDVDVGLGEYREDFRSSTSAVVASIGYLFGADRGQGKRGKSVNVNKTKKTKTNKKAYPRLRNKGKVMR